MDNESLVVEVLDKKTGLSSSVNLSDVSNPLSSVFRVSLDLNDVHSFENLNNNLIVNLKSGEEIVFPDFFLAPEEERNELIIEDTNGIFWWGQYDVPWTAFSFTELQPLDELPLIVEDGDAGGFAWWMAAAGLGALALLSSGGGSSGSSHATIPTSPEVTDTESPSVPVISDSVDDVTPQTGSLSSGDRTNDTTPTLQGTAEAGSTVSIFQDGEEVGSTTADTSGEWSFTTPELTEGSYAFTATATDAAGNESAVSSEFSLVIDTTAPGTGDGANSIAFNDGGDGQLNAAESTSVTLSGQIESDATITGLTISDGNAILTVDNADISVDGSGVVTVTGQDLSGLDDGTLTMTMTVADAAGNSGEVIDTTVLDATPPAAPVIDETNGTLVTGTAEPGSTVSLDVDGDDITDYQVPVGQDGTWSVDVDPDLADGTTITATATDVAGNTGPEGTQVVDIALVDVTPPPAPVITNGTDDVAPQEGTLSSGDSTNDTTPTLEGTAEAGSTVTVFQDGVEIGTTVVDSFGEWNFTVPALVEDSYLFTATATDAAGNESAVSAGFNLTVDTTSPTTTISIDSISIDSGANTTDFITNDSNGLTVNGTLSAALEVGESLMYSSDGGSTWINITSAVSGTSVSYEDTGLTVTTTVQMRVVDGAGNTGSLDSQLVVIDQTAPSVAAASGNVSEEGLVGGIADSSGLPVDSTDLAVLSGSLNISDTTGIHSISLSGPDAITSNDENIVWTQSFGGGVYRLVGTGEVSGNSIAQLNVSPNGDYTFTLNGAVDHSSMGVEDILSLNFGITVTDTAGNSSEQVILTVNVEDDMPVAAEPVLFSITATPAAETGSLVTSFGADGGFVSKVTIDGYTFEYDPEANFITTFGASDTVLAFQGSDYDVNTYQLTINTIKGETLIVNMVTGDYDYTHSGIAQIAPQPEEAPIVALGENDSLLGLVGAEALSLINFSQQQAFAATDSNNDIVEVEIVLDPALSLLSNGLEASQELADELGISFTVHNSTTLGILDSSTITVTASDGVSPIDNQKLNEFLGSIYASSGVSLGLGSTFSITATDAEGNVSTTSNSSLLSLGLLQDNEPDYLIEGTSGGETLVGTADAERLYGYGGDDTLSGGDGSDLIRGGGGADILAGDDGNDILVGGSGDDQLTGGSGLDVFRWESGDQGAAGSPSVDTITDFNFASVSADGDVIDLSDLLVREGGIGTNPGNLTNYLHFEWDGINTIIHISSNGQYLGGFDANETDQQIVVDGVNLLESMSNDYDIIAKLLRQGNLRVDEATADTLMLGGITEVNAVVSDNDGDTSGASVVFDSTGASGPSPSSNVAPVVQTDTSALLGVAGVGLIGLINLNEQDLIAADADGNLQSVTVAYQPLLNVNLDALQLTASAALAEELGLEFRVENDAGILGVISPSSVLTVTAVGGGSIDNLAVNELLKTVSFENGQTLLGLDTDIQLNILDATTITAIDSEGLSATASLSETVNLDALSTLLGNSGSVIEGDSSANTLNGTNANENIYGYDGNDIINGGGGSDLIRGGSGGDTLNGGSGNDTLIDGAGSDTFIGGIGDDVIWTVSTAFASIDGGEGYDVLLLDGGISLNLVGDTSISNIEEIDLGSGDGASVLTLDESAVLALTDENDQLIINGDGSDSVSLVGASLGSELQINGVNYQEYVMGDSTVYIEEEVTNVIIS